MTEEISGYKAVKRLAVERPDWLPIVRECLNLAKEIKGDFAGAWVFKRVQEKGLKFSNLRLLVSFGILKKKAHRDKDAVPTTQWSIPKVSSRRLMN